MIVITQKIKEVHKAQNKKHLGGIEDGIRYEIISGNIILATLL